MIVVRRENNSQKQRGSKCTIQSCSKTANHRGVSCCLGDGQPVELTSKHIETETNDDTLLLLYNYNFNLFTKFENVTRGKRVGYRKLIIDLISTPKLQFIGIFFLVHLLINLPVSLNFSKPRSTEIVSVSLKPSST